MTITSLNKRIRLKSCLRKAPIMEIADTMALRMTTLSLSEKRFNRKHSRIRILVEHVLSRMKKYQILAQVYRHKMIDYNRRFRNMAALVNFRLASSAI